MNTTTKLKDVSFDLHAECPHCGQVVTFTTASEPPALVEVTDEIRCQALSDWNLSVRANNSFKKVNLRYVADLLEVSEIMLYKIPQCGHTTVKEIKDALSKRGLRLPEKGTHRFWHELG